MYLVFILKFSIIISFFGVGTRAECKLSFKSLYMSFFCI